MSEKDLKTWWNEMREELSAYLQARAKLTKLQAYERIAKVIGVAISFFILAFLVGFVIMFILFMIGSWVVQMTDSVAIGFSSVALLVIGLFIFLVVKRKAVLEKPVSNWLIEALFDEEEFLNEEKKNDTDGSEE